MNNLSCYKQLVLTWRDILICKSRSVFNADWKSVHKTCISQNQRNQEKYRHARKTLYFPYFQKNGSLKPHLKYDKTACRARDRCSPEPSRPSIKLHQKGMLRSEHRLPQPACRGDRGNATSLHPHPHEISSVLAQSPVTCPATIHELQRYFQSLLGSVQMHTGGNGYSERASHLYLCYTPKLSFSSHPLTSCFSSHFLRGSGQPRHSAFSSQKLLSFPTSPN